MALPARTSRFATHRWLGVCALPGDDLASAGAARRYVRETARFWSLADEAVETLESVTGELAANALEHSGSREIVVVLGLTGHRTAVISVVDEGAVAMVTPAVPARESESEGGRGLRIVQTLAERWGWRGDVRGVAVWCEVAVGSGPPTTAFCAPARPSTHPAVASRNSRRLPTGSWE
ncbi:ATP-binding protein [Streptomyces sp. MST-110588]|uniref:ATP-binding protein n=1 Tax=Streptomyces sp. MST-110588 TaxID=2833628 RepID=UPI001F5D0A68|nr:ATP-binding protein [Streptomyces sp. MST-110588]UNO41581.1 ATP-binding protein [Streptomyces sp. MST-110588]